MTPERREQIESLYEAASRTQPDDRTSLLEQADPEVRREVEWRLAQDGPMLDRPAAEHPPERTAAMPAAGDRLGRYEIENSLGAGGMGEVFRARDTRLNRTVALKVSKTRFSERFEREARAIAALNHPNICQLYDVSHHGGVDFLVMEYLEGETLSTRLKKGPLPLEQVIGYGMEIAAALDLAHREGVTHRDLKPGNIMLTKPGAKLLDFGLAKWKHSTSVPEVPLSQIPTQTAPLTAPGTILGTLPYMAPEQLEGKEADARSDIFALGAVLYEMATGKRAFGASSQASLMAEILQSDPPPIRSLQPMMPAPLERLVRTCLAKDPDQRVQSAHDVKLELEWVRESPLEAQNSFAPAGSRRTLSWALLGATVLALALFAWLRGAGARSAAEVNPVRFEVPLPKGASRFTSTFPFSPDSRKLAFAAAGADGISRIWIRDLDSLEAHVLTGTESAGALLIWSPDSREIAFESGGKLLKIDISGGFPKTLCTLDRVVLSGAWSKEGVILFGGVGGPVMQLPADGGVPMAVTSLDTEHGDVAHLNPYFLPDGRHFLYVRESNTSRDISVASLDAKPSEQDSRRLIQGAFGPMYIPSTGSGPGQLLFVRGTTLTAQRFDPGRLTLSGEPIRALDAPVDHLTDSCLCSIASNGMLAYRSPANLQTQLTWFDERGNRLATVGPPGSYESLALSPDGSRALVSAREAVSNPSLWVFDTSRDNAGTPLTSDPATAYGNGGAWSPDGRSIIFNVGHSGAVPDLYRRTLDGAGDGTLLLHSARVKHSLSWSSDDFLLFNVLGKGFELWALPVKEPANAVPLLQGGPSYVNAQFSPDGRWIAYASNESSRAEIYVRSFSKGRLGEGGRISRNGGAGPKWGRDGKLYYLGLEGKLMALKLSLGSGVEAGPASELFAAPRTAEWAPAPDGKKFLFLVPQPHQDTPLTLVLNWQAGLKQ